jgi:hypothetical protein
VNLAQRMDLLIWKDADTMMMAIWDIHCSLVNTQFLAVIRNKKKKSQEGNP